jgi:CHAD domain-containing protein
MSDESATAVPNIASRADDFLAPLLFGMVSRVRVEAQRVASHGPREGPRATTPDPEAIHDFRVALRRLRTALRPARTVFGKRHVGVLAGELRRYAQVTGALRDEEVLRETLRELHLPDRARAELASWLLQRGRHERARRRNVGALIGALDPIAARGLTLGDVLARLERRLGRRCPDEHAARALAERALETAARDVAERLRAPTSDSIAMHELRIRYKRLRYTAEIFAPLLGERASEVAKEAARMQKHLGELHDLDEALTRIRRARSLSDPTRGSVRRALARVRAHCSRGIAKDLAAAHHLVRDRTESRS